MNANLERGALLHKRYRIVEILGQGGMGSVYRAVDENLGVDVAVKENLFTTDEYSRQFRLEAVLLANLRHPNLPRVTDHFTISDQGQYLIMDYIEGEDLRQRMERVNSISEEEAILVGVAMCDALQYLHTRKPSIIHRDVKPGNVRITSDGHVYLVDFGLAKLIKGSQATTTGARAMTPGYSPPEQYGTARTDPRTDIYSLGATLYAALTGVIPEDGLARAMDNVELTPLRKRNPKISRRLASAIEKAMSVRPEDRFQSAEEFKHALVTSNVKTQHLEGEIIVEPPPQVSETGEDEKLAREIPPAGNDTPPPPPSKPHKRKGWDAGFWIFFSFFLLTILAVVLATILFWTPISKTFLALVAPSTPTSATSVTSANPTTRVVDTTLPTLPPTRTATSSRTQTPTKTLLPTSTPSITPTSTETLTPTPTLLGGGYSQLAFTSSHSNILQVFIANADGSALRQVTDMPNGACEPDWSPDGMKLVFISPCMQQADKYPDAKLYIINADRSGLTELPASVAGDFDPAWSPDGKRIAFTSMRDGSMQIYLMNLDDNTVSTLTQPSTDIQYPDWSRYPTWSPNGTQIAYTGHSKYTSTLQIWAMNDSGNGKTLLVHQGDVTWGFQPDWSSDEKIIGFIATNGPQAQGWLMSFDYEHRSNIFGDRIKNGLYAADVDISPDVNWLAFESTEDSGRTYHVYLMTLSGQNRHRLTDDPTQMEFDPVWRPVSTP